MAELISLILVVADVPSHADIGREDAQDREPTDVVQQLVASLALDASEKGADFTHHWLVSRERGAFRVRENYPAIWKEIVAAAPCETLFKSLLQLLREWTLALAECQFRSVRHAAVVAALHVVEGLGIHCHSLQEFCGNTDFQIQDAHARGAQKRLEALSAECEQARGIVRSLTTARDALGVALLSRRTKDVDPEIRRSCFEALCKWVNADAQAYLNPQWTRYLHFGLHDRDAKVRAAALSALQPLLRNDSAGSLESVNNLVQHARPRILARCLDVDPLVGAAAVRCAAAIAARGLLGEPEFDAVADLIWDPDEQRRFEAAGFVSRFVFAEDVLDYPADGLPAGALLPTGSGGSAAAQRRVLMLLQFVSEYAEGHLALAGRLVSALWRRSSCLEDWEVLGRMALPGGEQALTGQMHNALVHLAEAIVHCAFSDVAKGKQTEAVAHAEAVLDRAARSLLPRFPAFLAACQAEPAAMRCAARICRHLLGHCVKRQGQSGSLCDCLLAGRTGEALAEALKTAFVRQPEQDTLEHLAEAFAYLLDLAAGVRALVLDLAGHLHNSMMRLVPLVGPTAPKTHDNPSNELLLVALRLRILAKAIDVSLGQIRGFCAGILQLLDDSAQAAEQAGHPSVGSQLVVVLFELVAIVLMRHIAAFIQPKPLPHCVVHDPVCLQELPMVPTAAKDLCRVAAATLRAASVPHVRTAAFGAVLAVLTAWSNAARFAETAEALADGAPGLQVDEDSMEAMCGHLGDLLTEANAVPPDCARQASGLDSDVVQPSTFSRLFGTLQHLLAAQSIGGWQEDTAVYIVPDPERVHLAALACALVGACRHPDIVDSMLPAVVLTQALSAREDLQHVAWALLGSLRKDAYQQPERADMFFKTLLHAVYVVHRDAGVDVARDLSSRLLLHVAVGKLPVALQHPLVAALRAGVRVALRPGSCHDFLGAMVPWVTKHILDDSAVQEFALWLQAEGQASVSPPGGDPAGLAATAGLALLLEACAATVARSERPATRGATQGGGAKAMALGDGIDNAGPAADAGHEGELAARRRLAQASGKAGDVGKRQRVGGPCPAVP